MPHVAEDRWSRFLIGASAETARLGIVPATSRGVNLFDQCCAILGLLVVASIVPGLIGAQHIGAPGPSEIPTETDGDRVKQVVHLVVYLVLAVVLVVRSTLTELRTLGIPIILLTAWTLASAIWSVTPDATTRRIIALLGPVIIGLFIGTRFSLREITGLLVLAGAIVLVGSWLHGAAQPPLGFDHNGRLRGLFAHKNDLGALVGLTSIAAVLSLRQQRQRRWRILAFLSIALVTILVSGSATPLAGLAAVAGALATLFLLRRLGGSLLASIPALAGVTFALRMLFAGELLAFAGALFGRDVTLSGRTTIWQFVVEKIGERPLQGYGYGVFWLGENSPGSLFWYWHKQFELHAHNGYLQLALDTGLVGCALFATSILVLLDRLRRLERAGDGEAVDFALSFLVYFAVVNFAETKLWQSNEVLTAVLVMVYSAIKLRLAAAPVAVAAALPVRGRRNRSLARG